MPVLAEVVRGTQVVRADGALFGRVLAVRADGVVVQKPHSFDEDRFVRFCLIERADEAGLHLTAAGHLATDPVQT
jgi:hypothetical protein